RKASIDFSHSASSGEARLIRYESCATTARMPASSCRCWNRSTCSGGIGLAFHWLLFLVKICTASQSTFSARSIALSTPPAIDICAPKSSMLRSISPLHMRRHRSAALSRLSSSEQRVHPLPVEPEGAPLGRQQQRAPQQRRLCDHQVQQLVVRHLALGEPQFPVGPAALRQRLAGRQTRAPQYVGQLLAREALLEVVAPHVLDPSLLKILLSLATARSRRMDVDLDVVRHLPDPLPSGSIPCPTW